jgi:hypothetical protein
VLTAECQGRRAHPVRIGVGQPRGAMIVGSQGVRSEIPESLQQLAYGAGRQVEGAGEAGGRLAAPGALPELLPHGDRDGLGHGNGLPAGVGTAATILMMIRSASRGKTSCRYQCGKTYCPVTNRVPYQRSGWPSVGFINNGIEVTIHFLDLQQWLR